MEQLYMVVREDANGNKVRMNDGCTKERAEEICGIFTARAHRQTYRYIPYFPGQMQRVLAALDIKF